MSKLTFTAPIHVLLGIISVCIIKSMIRSTFVFGSTSNSNKLDEKVKIVVN